MKWTFVIQQKMKAAALLACVMALVIAGNLLSSSQMKDIDQSFASIYKDRLIPATTITYLAEHLYGKRLAMEKFLLVQGSDPAEKLNIELNVHDRSIDSLISRFEETVLVDDEVKCLTSFKNWINTYAAVEMAVLTLEQSGDRDAAKRLFHENGLSTFQSVITRLNELTDIQSNVGLELMRETRSSIAGFSAISFLQIGLAVLIGLVVLGLIGNADLIHKSRAVKDGAGRFNLN